MLRSKRVGQPTRRRLRWETLEDRRLLAATFEIENLFTTAATVIEHGAVTGDDRGGIAISRSHAFYTGDSGTGAFSADDLTPGSAGTVTNLGPLGIPGRHGCENWAFWGVAEHFDGSDYVTYVQDSSTIARTRVSDGQPRLSRLSPAA